MQAFSRKQVSLAAACILALAASGAAQAQFSGFGPPETREVWVEGTKTQVWRSGYGLCWHSAFGPPPGYGECNPAPVAQYVAPPPVVAPAPAPVVAPPPAPVVEPAPLPPRQTRG